MKIDSKHKTSQPFKEPIPSKLANLATKYWKYKPSHFSIIKKLEEKMLAPEICVTKLNREIFFSKGFQPSVKRANNHRIRDTQIGVVKATVAFIKVSEPILNAERENYVINTKEVLSAA